MSEAEPEKRVDRAGSAQESLRNDRFCRDFNQKNNKKRDMNSGRRA